MAREADLKGLNGFCDIRFAGLIDVLNNNFSSGLDTGASLAVTLDGEMVVDLWGGFLDLEKTQSWQEDTIVDVFSSTKTMTFLCALILADRGLLDFDRPVAEYWPEFAQNGKEKVLVWHVMDHASGLPGFDEPITSEELLTWHPMAEKLAAQAPWFEPGTETSYHAFTQGILIGELVRRITGISIGQFFHEEVAQRLGADFYIGIPDEQMHKAASIVNSDVAFKTGEAFAEAANDPIVTKTIISAMDAQRQIYDTPAIRQAELPATGGFGNARAIAKVHAILACKGEANGQRFLSVDTAESIMKERISGTDRFLMQAVRFGLGFGLNPADSSPYPNLNCCGWGGNGGSIVHIDQDARLSVGFAMNKMEAQFPYSREPKLMRVIYDALAT